MFVISINKNSTKKTNKSHSVVKKMAKKQHELLKIKKKCSVSWALVSLHNKLLFILFINHYLALWVK